MLKGSKTVGISPICPEFELAQALVDVLINYLKVWNIWDQNKRENMEHRFPRLVHS